MRMIAALTMAVLAAPVFAQEMPKPGPEHEWLKKQEGTWTTTMKAGGTETKGTVTFKMELGGFWLVGSLEGELFGAKFQGKSLETYEPAKKKFTSLWVDSMGPGSVTTEGTYDKDTKTLTLAGTGPGHDGAATKYKSVTTYPDDDTMTMTMYMGDAKDPAFTVEYKRKK